jgi:outer membrane protein assembly factor BamB
MRIGKSVLNRILTVSFIIFLFNAIFSSFLNSYTEYEGIDSDLEPEPKNTTPEHMKESEKIVPYIFTRSNYKSSESCWPMFKNTPDRRGTSQSSIPGTSTSPPKILWSNQTAPTYSSPVIYHSKLYLTTNDGRIFCFEETTGKLRWEIQVTSDKYSALSTPAISSGYLVVYSPAEGKIFRLDASSGALNWTYEITEKNASLNISYLNQPILVHKGNIFFGAPNRYFYCINESSGKLVWKHETQDGLTYDYGITGGAAAKGNNIYMGANDGYLYALDLDGFNNGNQGWLFENDTGLFDGDVLWKYFTGDSISSTPVIFENYVYVTVGIHNSSGGDYNVYKIYCIDRQNGTLVWDFKTSDHLISSPAVADNKVIFGGLDKKVYCLNTDSNISQWAPFYTDGEIWSSPVVASGKIVIGSKDSKLYCLYSHNGILIWEKNLDDPITGSPALANNRVYINTQKGRIYAIGPPDTEPPRVVKTIPKDDAVDVPVSSKLNIKFSEPLCPESVSNNNIILYDNEMNEVPIDVSYDDKNIFITIIPKTFLNISSIYTVSATVGIGDCAGNRLDGNENNISDGSPEDDHTWTFTTSKNHPPELTNVKVNPNRGDLSTSFTFSVLYTDQDNDAPGFNDNDIMIFFDDRVVGHSMVLNDSDNTPEIWHNRNFTDGEQYIYKTKLKTLGVHSFRIWCFDGTDWNETVIFGKPILPGPPKLKTIPEQKAVEDIELILNLSEYLKDPDTPIDQLKVYANSSYAEVNGMEIKFLYPNSFTYPKGSRYDIVNISVTDQEFFSFKEVVLWVISVNDPPEISPIPNHLVVKGSEKDYNLSLKEYISDVDNPFDELKIHEDSDFAKIVGEYLEFNYSAGIENETINLYVTDGEHWTNGRINVEVISSEVSFVIKEIPSLKVVEDIEFTLDMLDHIIIVQGAYENLELNCSSKYSIIDGLSIKFIYSNNFNYPSGKKVEEVTISVRDANEDYVQSTKVEVNVEPLNDAPELTGGGVDPEFGNISQDFTFSINYFDVDGSENNKVFVIIDGTQHKMQFESGEKNQNPGALYTFSTKLEIGNHYYYFRCNDGSGAPNNQLITKARDLFVTGNLGQYYDNNGAGSQIPEDRDSDHDGIPDYWELCYNLDPFNNSDALVDSDGDNFNNYLEYLGKDGQPLGNDSTAPDNPSDKPILQPDEQTTQRSESFEQWQLVLAIFTAIIIGIIIIYSLFSSRGLGIHMRIPKIMMSPDVMDKHPYTEQLKKEKEKKAESEEEDDEEMIIDDDVDDEEDIEIIDLTDEELDSEIPLTEVDLTDDERPFLESEDLYDENGNIGESGEEGEGENDTDSEPDNEILDTSTETEIPDETDTTKNKKQ